MPKITPFLWFNTQAEEAVNYYVSIFPNSKVVKTTNYPKGTPAPEGSVMTVVFELDGQEFTALSAFEIPTREDRRINRSSEGQEKIGAAVGVRRAPVSRLFTGGVSQSPSAYS